MNNPVVLPRGYSLKDQLSTLLKEKSHPELFEALLRVSRISFFSLNINAGTRESIHITRPIYRNILYVGRLAFGRFPTNKKGRPCPNIMAILPIPCVTLKRYTLSFSSLFSIIQGASELQWRPSIKPEITLRSLRKIT